MSENNILSSDDEEPLQSFKISNLRYHEEPWHYEQMVSLHSCLQNLLHIQPTTSTLLLPLTMYIIDKEESNDNLGEHMVLSSKQTRSMPRPSSPTNCRFFGIQSHNSFSFFMSTSTGTSSQFGAILFLNYFFDSDIFTLDNNL